MKYVNQITSLAAVALLLLSSPAALVFAQSPEPNFEETQKQVIADAGPERHTLSGKKITFDSSQSFIPEDTSVQETLWDFGDGTRTTGEKVSHSYARPGTYNVTLTVTTDQGHSQAKTQVRVFNRVIILLADASATEEQLALARQQAADEKTLLVTLKAKTSGPEAAVEEELTNQLINARNEVTRTHIIAAWTSGSVGPNVLSKFAQHIRQADELSYQDLNLDTKGIILFTDSSLKVLSPTAQSMFDQLRPEYVLLTRPSTLQLLYDTDSANGARDRVIGAPTDHLLLGAFSSRAIEEISLFNFVSVGINYLLNHGVPINNIILVLMIPVIATILAFARQVIGIKAFGLITPAITTLSFLVLGLPSGLIVFIVVLLSGSLTRLVLRKLHLLYLPRMALVLTSVSLAILVMLGIGAATGQVATLSFSIFPILILTILAEEFIAVQFTRGFRTALRVTGWTLLLVIACYLIVSWELLRTVLLSYPELVLLAIPINIILGRFTGLRLTEYIRFRELLRYTS